MNINTTDPREQGRNESRLISLARNNFEPIHSTLFPGHVWKARCKKCGHELKINQFVWQLRHWLKHSH